MGLGLGFFSDLCRLWVVWHHRPGWWGRGFLVWSVDLSPMEGTSKRLVRLLLRLKSMEG